MTLALTLGMTIGVKRTLWMMLGELLAVGILATIIAIGVGALLLKYPSAFLVLKYGGGAYLFYLGIQLCLSKGKMAIKEHTKNQPTLSPFELALQGFITAISNPKGWAFFVVLLPPFLTAEVSLVYQLSILISLILILEFICLIIYASGGVTLRSLLMRGNNVKTMNSIAGILMIGVGIWLAVG